MNREEIHFAAEHLDQVDLDMLPESTRRALYDDIQQHSRGLDDVVDRNVAPEIYAGMERLRNSQQS